MVTPSSTEVLLPTPRVKNPDNAKRVALAKEVGIKTFRQTPTGQKGYFMDGLIDWLNFHNLLSTPVAADAAQGAAMGIEGSMGLARLIAMRQAGLLPTPIATDWKSGTDKDKKGGGLRNDCLRHLFKHIEKRGTDDLPDRQKPLAEMLLTPRATDGLRSGMPGETLVRRNHKNAEKSNLKEQIAHKTGGGNFHLNPLFVEEMMGFPKGWTIFPFLRESGDGRR